MHLISFFRKSAHNTNFPPLLFVHGAWHSAWCWEENFIPYFSQHGFTSYAISLSGHGNSPIRPDKRFHQLRIKDYVEDLQHTIDSMRIKPILVGHSMGALVVQKYLESNTAPAAILLAPPPLHGIIGTTLRFAFKHPIRFMQGNLTMRLDPAIATPELTKESFFSDDVDNEKLLEYHKHMQDESFHAYLDMIFRSFPKPKKVNTPMLVLGAEDDGLMKAKHTEKLANAYGTNAKFFSHMAHDMMLEEGWQRVADYMRNWLVPFANSSINNNFLNNQSDHIFKNLHVAVA